MNLPKVTVVGLSSLLLISCGDPSDREDGGGSKDAAGKADAALADTGGGTDAGMADHRVTPDSVNDDHRIADAVAGDLSSPADLRREVTSVSDVTPRADAGSGDRSVNDSQGGGSDAAADDAAVARDSATMDSTLADGAVDITLPGKLYFLRDGYQSENDYWTEIVLHQDTQSQVLLRLEQGTIFALTATSDGQKLAYIASQGNMPVLRVYNTTDQQTVQLGPYTYQDPYRWGFHPSQNWLWWSVTEFGIGNPKLVRAAITEPSSAEEIVEGVHGTLSPDGDQFLVARLVPAPTVYLRNWDPPWPEPQVGQGLVAGRHPAWSPSGDRISYIAPGNNLVVSAVSGSASHLTYVADDARSFVWSPDGTSILYIQDSTIHVVNVATGDVTVLTTPHADGLPTWSPDGAYIAWESGQPMRTSIYVTRVSSDDSLNLSQGLIDPYDSRPCWVP